MPDDQLLDLAIRGKLRDPGVLDQQVRRMLADPRARTSLVENFFEQWLETRNVWLLTPDANQHFPWASNQCNSHLECCHPLNELATKARLIA